VIFSFHFDLVEKILSVGELSLFRRLSVILTTKDIAHLAKVVAHLVRGVAHLEEEVGQENHSLIKIGQNVITIFVTTCDYIWTFLQLFFVLVIFAITLQVICNHYGFHPRRTTYVPLVANVTNLSCSFISI
jgi:hypothetical protein